MYRTTLMKSAGGEDVKRRCVVMHQNVAMAEQIKSDAERKRTLSLALRQISLLMICPYQRTQYIITKSVDGRSRFTFSHNIHCQSKYERLKSTAVHARLKFMKAVGDTVQVIAWGNTMCIYQHEATQPCCAMRFAT